MFSYTGGTLVETAKECSVLVTNAIKRTCKLMACLGKGVPIVSSEWVSATKQAGNFVGKYLVFNNICMYHKCMYHMYVSYHKQRLKCLFHEIIKLYLVLNNNSFIQRIKKLTIIIFIKNSIKIYVKRII